jgi:dihydroxyacetone kinase DhaKLM complex PTS-EIIA-like component DhaM
MIFAASRRLTFFTVHLVFLFDATLPENREQCGTSADIIRVNVTAKLFQNHVVIFLECTSQKTDVQISISLYYSQIGEIS